MRILASADIHLGMKFSTYDEVGPELSNARFNTLARCVDAANDEKCDIFVIAGDLFDRQNVSRPDIKKAAELLSRFSGSALLILPGNHDFYTGGDGGPWAPFIEEISVTSVPAVVLSETRRYTLDHFDLPVSVFPGPCAAKHSPVDNIAWIREQTEEAEKEHLKLGIAHGSVEGLSPDLGGNYYPMTRSRLDTAPVDLWIIGHTHRPYPEAGTTEPRLFIPGTHEPDGFDCPHRGGVWIIECSGKRPDSYRRIDTGTYRFYDIKTAVEEASDITGAISVEYPERSLVSLAVSGALDRGEYEKLPGVLEELQKQIFYFRTKLDGLEEVVSTETVDDEFTPGSFPNSLIRSFIEDHDTEAAQVAYRLLKGLET